MFQNLHAIKSYISAHQSPVRGYNLAYDHIPKHTRGIISCGHIFGCYTGRPTSARFSKPGIPLLEMALQK